MPLEPDFDHIDDLDPANPFPDDPVSEGDDHLRGIKNALQGNVSGDDTETRLLVAGLVKALVDGDGLTAQDRVRVEGTLLDVVDPGNELITIRMRNQFGGYRFLTLTDTGQLQVDQTDPAGTSEKQVITASRDAGINFFFDGLNALATQDRSAPAAANSSVAGFDSLGIARPLGWNTLPRADIGAALTLNISHVGKRLRFQTVGALTLVPTLFADAAFVVYAQSGGTIVIPAGTLIRYFKGESFEQLDGPLSVPVTVGAALTFCEFGASIWEVWGAGLNV